MNLEIKYTANCSVDSCKREQRSTLVASSYDEIPMSKYYTEIAMEMTRRGWTQISHGVWECERDHTKPDDALIENVFPNI